MQLEENIRKKRVKTYIIHIGLFVVSLLTTMVAGAEHATGKIFIGWGIIPPEALISFSELHKGLPYALSFLAFLSFHEFGHYFTAVYHKVKCSLPFYIPVYIPLPGAVNIGSFGAVIRLKQRPESTQKYFDIGIAGPLAGFVVSILILMYGFLNLPDLEQYVLNIHPEYIEQFGGVPTYEEMLYDLQEKKVQTYMIGSSLLFEFLKNVLVEDPSQIPPHFELMHYPYLFVGYLTLFFTALNLLPIGQLDGGHVMYGLFGPYYSGLIARLAVVVLLFIGGLGVLDVREFQNSDQISAILLRTVVYIGFLYYVLSKAFYGSPLSFKVFLLISLLTAQLVGKYYFPNAAMNFIWLFYSFLVVRFVGVDHPPALIEKPISPGRKVLGWFAILIFILCFSPSPIKLIG